MYVLHAREHLIGDVRRLIETRAIKDVEVHRPFLGRAVIQCSSEQSAELLRSSIAGLRTN